MTEQPNGTPAGGEDRRVLTDRQGHPIVSRKIGRLLTIAATKKIKREIFTRITDGRRLRPSVRPQRGNRHDPVLVQKRKDFPSEFFVQLRLAQRRAFDMGG